MLLDWVGIVAAGVVCMYRDKKPPLLQGGPLKQLMTSSERLDSYPGCWSESLEPTSFALDSLFAIWNGQPICHLSWLRLSSPNSTDDAQGSRGGSRPPLCPALTTGTVSLSFNVKGLSGDCSWILWFSIQASTGDNRTFDDFQDHGTIGCWALQVHVKFQSERWNIATSNVVNYLCFAKTATVQNSGIHGVWLKTFYYCIQCSMWSPLNQYWASFLCFQSSGWYVIMWTIPSKIESDYAGGWVNKTSLWGTGKEVLLLCFMCYDTGIWLLLPTVASQCVHLDVDLWPVLQVCYRL